MVKNAVGWDWDMREVLLKKGARVVKETRRNII
jgi:hypothetical protein